MKKSFGVSGRKKGIKELLCVRCGEKVDSLSLQICSSGDFYRPMRVTHLDNHVLKFLGHPQEKKLMKAYYGATTTSTSTELKE